MILYFADRQLNILGQASTKLPQGLTVTNDKKIEDVETGVSSFECDIPYDRETRDLVERCTEGGNYLLCSFDGANEFYTIIEVEVDTYKQSVYIYAEDAGMDLLNEVFGVYEADKAYPIAHYINLFAAGSGSGEECEMSLLRFSAGRSRRRGPLRAFGRSGGGFRRRGNGGRQRRSARRALERGGDAGGGDRILRQRTCVQDDLFMI
jgi:hypothetical protein